MNTPGGKKGSARAADVSETNVPRALPTATAAWLRERLCDGAALPFAAAVVLHLTRRPGGDAAHAASGREIACRVVELLDDPAAPGAAQRLAADPPTLASFFQNADLLFEHGFAGADAVALLVMRALEILDPSA